MKLKSRPEDFIVEELTGVVPCAAGDFALYRLEKTGWTTPDALAAVRRRWKIDPRRLSHGGLKDRHAATTQHFTILHGPKRNLRHERIEVTYLGRVSEPFGPRQIAGNRFTITLRDLPAAADLEQAGREVARCGVPNYFDDQRFGSVGRGGRFIALEMIRGNFEEALKLALAEPYEFDRAAQKQEKATLRRHWGDWRLCKAKLPRGHARSLVDYLVHHPADFKGAAARLRPELSGLHLAAYQSAVWNRLLAAWLRARLPGERLAPLRLKLGTFPAPRSLPASLQAAWTSLELPLPSARLKPAGDEPWLPLLDAVLAEDGLELAGMRIRGLNRPYFARGVRAACLQPSGLIVTSAADELHPSRRQAVLRFDLPRGAYATMVVKRLITACEGGEQSVAERNRECDYEHHIH